MQIDNINKEPYYLFPSGGIDGTDIYVTGSHTVRDENEKYIHVKDHTKSIKQSHAPIPEWFSCLITDDHLIQIGDYVFWDWEDYLISIP